MERQILIADEVADLLRVDCQRVYELARRGVIPAIHVGERQYRFDASAIRRWIEHGGADRTERLRLSVCQARLPNLQSLVMGTRSRVADWISIITAPFSVLSIIGSLTGWLPNTIANHAESDDTRLAIAMILTIVQWLFLFSLLIRYFKVQARLKSDLGILWSLILGVGAVALFIAFELIILNAIIFPVSRLGLILWIGIPTAAWLIFGLFALLIIQSE